MTLRSPNLNPITQMIANGFQISEDMKWPMWLFFIARGSKIIPVSRAPSVIRGMADRNGEFARYADDELNLVAMTDCGDCPGLTFPRVKLLTEATNSLERPIDVIHFGIPGNHIQSIQDSVEIPFSGFKEILQMSAEFRC